MKRFIAILFSIISIQVSASIEQASVLLNQGKGNEAVASLRADIAASTGDDRLRYAYALIDACMLIDDEVCLMDVYSKNWKEMNDYLNRFDINNPSQSDTWKSIYDANSTAHFYTVLASLDEKEYNAALTYEEKNFTGSPYSGHGGLKLVGKAAIAAFLGKQSYAEQQLRRARALILNKDPGTIQAQSNLAYLFETSLFYLNDSRDIKRWFDANSAIFQQTGIDSSVYMNPYAYQRLALVLYNSGILKKQQQKKLIQDIHERFKLLEVADGSKLMRKKEEFYAFLAFSDPQNKEDYGFNPAEELSKFKSTAYASVGVKAYLSLYNNLPNLTELEDVLRRLGESYPKFGSATKLNLAPTQAIFESLVARAGKDKSQEIAALEKYADVTITLFANKGFKIGDNNPIQTNPSISVQRYVVDRLGQLKPNSEKRVNLGLLILQSINSSQFGDEEASYSILSKARSDIEVEQALNFITLKERYGHLIARSYKESSENLIKNQKISNIEEKQIVPAERSSFILDMFTKSNEQLHDLRSQKNDSFITDYKVIASRLGVDEVAIFSASSELFDVIAVISKNSSSLKVVPKSDFTFNTAKEALISQDIASLSLGEIQKFSDIVSKKIFDGSDLSRVRGIYLLNGPSLAGVPYTLLSNPSKKDWLIKNISVKAFYAVPQFLSAKNSFDDYRPRYKYVGFANPVLRGDEEIASVKNLASLIRGVKNKSITSLPELPETEGEVMEFARALGGKSEIYAGKRATIENLYQSNLNEIEVLGFATHGVMVGELDGVQSPSLVLTPHNDSGLVTSEILFSLHGSPKVAILSTCNSKTTRDSLDQNEITSLASSFSLKGTRAVIASYWAVNSDGTALLMSALAKYVSRGYSYSDSLLRAQVELMSSPASKHPAIWAAFVNVGDFSSKSANYLSETKLEFKNSIIDSSATLGDGLYVPSRSTNTLNMSIDRVSADMKAERVGFFEGLKSPSIKVSVDSGEVYFGAKVDGQYTIFVGEPSDRYKKLCSFPLASDWFIRKLVVSDYRAYVLMSRAHDSLNEPALASISLSSCDGTSNILKDFAFSNTDDVGMLPLKSKNRILFYAHKKLIDSKKFTAYVNELNLPRNCQFQDRLEYYVLDDSLRFINSGVELNLRLLGDIQNSKKWIHSIYTNECTFETYPKKIDSSWFEEKYLFHDNKGNLIRPGLSADEAMIGKNFTQIVSWSSGDSGDLIYVDGSPGITSVLFGSRSNLNISDKAKQAAINSEYSQYVYQKSKKKWFRVSTAEDCPVSKPFAFEKNVLFSCVVYDKLNPKDSASYIFKAPLN